VKKEHAVKAVQFLQSNNIAKGWSMDYFRRVLSETEVPVKTFSDKGEIDISLWSMEQYVDAIKQYEIANSQTNKTSSKGNQRPPYCHDVPIFQLASVLINDVGALSKNYFPSWYSNDWWNYAQFFISPTGSVTPLHFDTLLTHNIFFQVEGTKEFILFPKEQAKYFTRHNWRWFKEDPTSQEVEDIIRKNELGSRVVLNAGDMLYMPPGMLHYVKTIDASVSFNVDFHTKKSVSRSFLSLIKGMPVNSFYYNVVLLFGVVFNIPSKLLFRYYRSYLNYVS